MGVTNYIKQFKHLHWYSTHHLQLRYATDPTTHTEHWVVSINNKPFKINN